MKKENALRLFLTICRTVDSKRESSEELWHKVIKDFSETTGWMPTLRSSLNDHTPNRFIGDEWTVVIYDEGNGWWDEEYVETANEILFPTKKECEL